MHGCCVQEAEVQLRNELKRAVEELGRAQESLTQAAETAERQSASQAALQLQVSSTPSSHAFWFRTEVTVC